MFSAYQPPEHLKTVLSQAAISAADIDPNARTVSVMLKSPAYIAQGDLDSAAADIATIYGLSKVQIEPRFPSAELKKLPDPYGRF